MTKKKTHGQVFTPKNIVCEMLDELGYIASNDAILDKKIMEPSFGRGVFLVEIIERLVAAGRRRDMTPTEISRMVQENVWGIELDDELFAETVATLDTLLSNLGITQVNSWNLNEGDALRYKDDFLGFFDFVVGNPPYVRIHNIPESERGFIKEFQFATGTTDLYVVFFEMGINFLAENGKLAYITPNSFMKNTSQRGFRKFLVEKGLLTKLVDYRSSKVFNDASTYATITYLHSQKEMPTLFEYNLIDASGVFSETLDYITLISTAGSPWNFADPSGILAKQSGLKRVFSELASVQYGLATLRDKIYVDLKPEHRNDGTTLFHGVSIETASLRPVVKASTYRGGAVLGRIIFPYAPNGLGGYQPLSENDMKSQYPLAYDYLLSHREELETRNVDKNMASWFQYGRSQAISSTDTEKIVFSHVIHPDKVVEVFKLDAGTLVYSGFFVTSKDGVKDSEIKDELETQKFIDYAKIVGKDMSGGFVSITPRHVKEFRF